MKSNKLFGWMIVPLFLMIACNLSSNAAPAPDAEIVEDTPTPTFSGGVIDTEPTSVPSRCEGLSGVLELQVLVGPAEVVGLEPVSIGELPFSIISSEGLYLIQGGGSLSYEDVLEKDWGTYSVFFDMDGTVEGECSGAPGSEMINVTIETIGEQMVEVRAEGFSGDYPWEGTNTINLSLPLEDGATAQGEGWVVVLHLGG